MRPFRVAALAALLLAAVPAAAQHDHGPRGARNAADRDPRDQRQDWSGASPEELGREATRHVALVWTRLVDASTNAEALRQITAEKDLYNASHARPLATAIQSTLPVAEFHLNTLRAMTRGRPLAARVDELQARIDRAKPLAARLEKELRDAAALHADATKVAEALAATPAIARELSEKLGAKLRLPER